PMVEENTMKGKTPTARHRKNNLPCVPCVEVSTCHITQRDDEILNSRDDLVALMMDRKAFGYMFQIAARETIEDVLFQAHEAGMSEAFAKLYRAADSQGARLLIL